ncbi:unnamed protein product [Candidula unifasciata]|uniref:Protein quiver n=1 Tax=Candidula unifasciata TaxID=100452 RepID=A0A8S3Z6E9_9EUPU|nr:unnamed protein product [Candidula unifasciata]
MLIKLWLPVLLLLLEVQVSNAVYCFICNSIEKPACGDDFRISPYDADSRSYCPGSCVKRRGKRAVGSVPRIEVVRSCVSSRPETCFTEQYNGLKVFTCACNYDFCNV